MRFSFAILSLAVASASASSLYPRQLPNCAATCLASANFGSCQPTDNACLCRNTQFIQSSTTCIEGACSGSDLQNALAAARALCAAVGVTLTDTPTASASGSAVSATATSPSSVGSSASSSGSAAASAASATTTRASSSAASNGINALAGIAAVGLAALAL